MSTFNQNKTFCFNKSFIIVSTILVFLLSLVLLSNKINSQKLSQNSRATFGAITLDSYKTASSPATWSFMTPLCDCLEASRSPSLSQIKIIKNNRSSEVILNTGGFFKFIDENNSFDREVKQLAIEGTISDTFIVPESIAWKYCNGENNAVSPLGTYWIVRKTSACPLRGGPTPFPELLPDLQISFVGSYASESGKWNLVSRIKNGGTKNTIASISSYLYIDPLSNPFLKPTASTPSYSNRYGAGLAIGDEYSWEKSMMLTQGLHRLYVWVDPNNEIPEINEVNNQFECVASVQNGKNIVCNTKIYNTYTPFVGTAIASPPGILVTPINEP